MFLYFLGVATLGTYLDLVLNPCDCTPRPSVKYASYLITDHVYWPALLFFNIDSGHGGQTPDLDGDEVDGLDEGRSPFTRFCLLLSHTMFRDERMKCTPSSTVLGCMIHRIFSRSFFFSFVHSRTLFVTTALSKIGEFMTVVASFFADKWFPLFFSDLPTRLPDHRSHRWWCGWFFLFTKLSQAPWYFCLFHFIGNACDYGENFTFGMSSYGEIDRLCCFHAISSCTIFFFCCGMAGGFRCMTNFSNGILHWDDGADATIICPIHRHVTQEPCLVRPILQISTTESRLKIFFLSFYLVDLPYIVCYVLHVQK